MAVELSQNILWHGIDEAPSVPVWLAAGPVAAGLEEGQLRGIFLSGGKEIVRRIYAAVRDRFWNTVPGVLRDLQVEQRTDGFRVVFTSEHVSEEVNIIWRAEITGEPDGTVRYAFDGEARREMLKNRVGLCVLLPLSLAGQSCVVEYVSGDGGTVNFPVMVDPMQPVRGLHDFRELRYEVSDGVELVLSFRGDVFEIEDQRNWTDASFKVYSTPQRIPLPGKMTAGQRVHQVVTLRLSGNPGALTPAAPPPDPETVNVDFGVPRGRLRGLGVGMASHGSPLTETELARLRALRLTPYLVEVDTSKPGWQAALKTGLREAGAMGAQASVVLPVSDDAGMEAVPAGRIAKEFPDVVGRWLVLTRGAPATQDTALLTARLCLADGKASIGGGTDADFFQLNNNRPPGDLMHFVSVPLRPCGHQFDRATLIENLEGQRAVLQTMSALWPGLTLTVSPVTFRTRAQKGPAPGPGELPAQADVRQMSLLGAAWTVGCVKAVVESGVENLTLFQTTGLRGIMERESGSDAPREFHSIAGGVFPVYIALAAMTAMLEADGAEVIEAVSDAPLIAEALVLRKGLQWRVLVANYSPRSRRVVLRRDGAGVFARAGAVVLDATNAVEAMTNPEAWLAAPPQRQMRDATVLLPPFAVAWVDL